MATQRAAGAHTEADGGHGGGFPPFETSTFASQLVSLPIAFVALYMIVSARSAARRRRDRGASEHDRGRSGEAQKLKDQSDAALKAYEGELASARSRAQAIGNETRDKPNAQRKPSARRWKSSSRPSSPRPRRPSPRRATTAMSNVRGIAADAAGAIVQQLTGMFRTRLGQRRR